MLPEASAEVLRAYVTTGGTLVAEARLAWNNERGYASDRIPGLGLWEVMGAREIAVETVPQGRASLRWVGADLPGLPAGATLPGRWYKEVLEPISPSARIVARFDDGAAAAVMNTFGAGRTLLLGSYVSAAYQTTSTPETAAFYQGLLAWAGVTLPIDVAGDAIEARHLETGDDALLFLFNHARTQASATVSLRRPTGIAAYAATSLLNGATVPVTRTANGVSVRVVLAPNDVQVLRIDRR
jgi:beta-galactosidase